MRKSPSPLVHLRSDELLLSQLELATPLTDRTREVARYIIGNISEDGYLTRTVEELQDDLLFKAGLDVTATELTHLSELDQDP